MFKSGEMEVEEEEEEVKWARHYSSIHQILLVGEGDFSFSLSLANAFGSAVNIVATSLDTCDMLFKKYSKAQSNVNELKKLGATIIHEVDATKMKFQVGIRTRKFDRIVYNFPHAGFKGKEDNPILIGMHKKLVLGFFKNASALLRPFGEVHVSHKTTSPFCKWNLEELASLCSLILIECAEFCIADYPGYNHKRGDGSRCDKSFPLRECSTFKFVIGRIYNKKQPDLTHTPPSVGHIIHNYNGYENVATKGYPKMFSPVEWISRSNSILPPMVDIRRLEFTDATHGYPEMLFPVEKITRNNTMLHPFTDIRSLEFKEATLSCQRLFPVERIPRSNAILPPMADIHVREFKDANLQPWINNLSPRMHEWEFSVSSGVSLRIMAPPRSRNNIELVEPCRRMEHLDVHSLCVPNLGCSRRMSAIQAQIEEEDRLRWQVRQHGRSNPMLY